MDKMQKRNFSNPDETRSFEHGRVDLISMDGVTFGKATFDPGWKWSTCVKPLAGTGSCEAAHLQCILSGRIHVTMNDGSEEEFGPGDVLSVPPGHDAWVVGSEPLVAIDITGMAAYAKG